MPGGRRSGQPGKAYPNRTDLMRQPVRTAPGQPYGQAGQQAAAQRAIPLPQSPPLPEVISPHAPTQAPDEHVMTGVPRGPGLGPEAITPPPVNMAAQPSNDDVRAQLKAILSVPGLATPGLIELVRSLDTGDYASGGLYGRALGQ